MDEESFTLLDDTSIAVLIPRTFNEEAMEQKTLLQAVDLCCKLFYVYDINYPKAFCSHLGVFAAQSLIIQDFLQHTASSLKMFYLVISKSFLFYCSSVGPADLFLLLLLVFFSTTYTHFQNFASLFSKLYT